MLWFIQDVLQSIQGKSRQRRIQMKREKRDRKLPDLCVLGLGAWLLICPHRIFLKCQVWVLMTFCGSDMWCDLNSFFPICGKLTWNVSRSYSHSLLNVRVIHVPVLYWHKNVSSSRRTMQSYASSSFWPFVDVDICVSLICLAQTNILLNIHYAN